MATESQEKMNPEKVAVAESPGEVIDGTDSSSLERDPNVVSFDGPNDPDDPRNWSRKYKWFLVALLSSMATMVNLGTLMCTPAVPLIQQDFKTKNNNLYSILLVSIWELGEAFGPLLVAPLSEYYGRVPVYHTANILFVAFSIASAVSSNTRMLIAFRFFNGLSVASITLNPAIVGDLFVTEEQGTGQAMMGLAPLIGPVFGPAIGGYMAESVGWRWMFWFLAIASGVIEMGFVCFYRETYKVTLLQRKTNRLRKETGNENLRPEIERPRGWKNFLQKAIIRPARMLFLSPVIFILAIYVSVVFAYLYILFTNITQVFETNYGFSTGSSGLVYIGLGMGMTVGMFLCRSTLDKYVKRMSSRQKMKPEQRLVPMIIGGFAIPLGLLLYGWTAQYRVQFIVPIIGLALCGFSVAATLIPSFSYLVHAFGVHSASAIAAIICLRCLAGVVLPLAAPSLYGRLGQGWGNTVLAGIAVAFVPVPVILMRVGERIRNSSRWKVES